MSNRDAAYIAKELSEKVAKRTAILDEAVEIVLIELKKYESVKYVYNEEKGHLNVYGSKYGVAFVDLYDWFARVTETYLAENVARDIMEEIENILTPERSYQL